MSSIIKWFCIKIWYPNNFYSKHPFFIGEKVRFFIEKGEIVIGNKARIGDYCEIQSRHSKIQIGDNFNLNSFSRIIAFNKISIVTLLPILILLKAIIHFQE